jgi:CBS domain-containing protein
MPSAFNFSISPFDCLTNEERKLVRNSLDIGYFREAEAILEPGVQPTHLFVIIKGYVQQFEGDELITTFGPDDSFDGRGLVAGKVSGRFVAAEEVVAYQLSKQAVSDLISSNATFGALLFSDLTRKLTALSERQSQHELQSLTMAQVEQAFIRPAHMVDADTDIVSVARAFHEHRTNCVLVQDHRVNPPRVGVFTNTGLQAAILNGTPLHQLAVRELANFELITVHPADHLFDALALMIRHQIHRLVVADDERIIGILHQLDLLSFLSNHSYLISLQIMEADQIETLKQAAEQITRLISLLFRGGTKVAQIARLVQELNAKLLERTWQLIAPPDLIANSCLFVMGSEGRGEQLLKTDQDNGLILRDGYICPHDLPALAERFSAALIEFGFPTCPGNIMISNPVWRQSVAEFSQTVRRWLQNPDPDNVMTLAIFMDSHAVCGDTGLLTQVRGELYRLATNNAALLSRFASAVEAFSNSSGWWNRLLLLGDSAGKELLDLKKSGTFPVVHGIRSLALEYQLSQTSTAHRIEALVKIGKLPPDMATDLIDSLNFFMALKLKVGLEAQETGRPLEGGIQVDKLSSLDRDLLKDTLGVVKRFKAMLHHRYHLESI